ncbi:MAG: hypothetical protein QW279_10685 [Candidatus Jordarchaeaceae archaeon]
MLERTLEEVLKKNSFIIFIDEQLANSNGYLRSLPLLIRISGNKIRNVIVWEPGQNCNKPLNLSLTDLNFIHPSSFFKTNELCCLFSNDEKDEMFRYVHKYVESEIPSIIVINNGNFIPNSWRISAKPLESKTYFPPYYFQSELNKYLNSKGLTLYQLPETKNLAFTEICYIHYAITSEKPKKITEIFDFEYDALVISPIWDWAINLLTLKKENKASNMEVFIFDALRPHIERNKDVEKVAIIFETFLKKYHNDIELIISTRKKIFKNQQYDYLLKQTSENILNTIIQFQLRKLKCQ